MITKHFLLYVAAVTVAAPLCSFAESLNVKPGAWEMTTTTSAAVNSLPPETLDKLSEAQRAKIESAWQAHAAKPNTFVSKDCVTQADLDKNTVINSDDEAECNKKIISQTASRMEIEQTCSAPQASTSNMVSEATSPESMTATMDMARKGSSGMIHIDIKGRWLGASCADITDGG